MSTLGAGHVPIDVHQQQTAWLSTPSLGLDVYSVLSNDSTCNLSVNSFDITNKHIVAVTDQEALFTMPNVIL